MDLFCEILYYEDDQNCSVRNWGISHPDASILETKMWEHYHNLGVDAFQANAQNTFGTVQWRLQDQWYTTSQIERIMKIRVFL